MPSEYPCCQRCVWVWMFTQSWIAGLACWSVGAAGFATGIAKPSRRAIAGGADGRRLACGGRMRYLGREAAPVETALGRVSVSMGRPAGDACGTSLRPREGLLDVEGSMTPSARRMASAAGSTCCYEEADRLLVELAEVNYGVKRIERAMRAVGADAEARRATALSGRSRWPALSAVDRRPSAGRPRPCADAQDAERRIDSALRAGRDGGFRRCRWRPPGGSARTAVAHARARRRSVRVDRRIGRRRRAADRGRFGAPRCTQRAFGANESAANDAGGDSPLARRLLRELAALGYAPEDVGVCLGDGAEWLRRLYRDWFPNAVRIVDFFHAAEYLWAAARARHGGDLAKAWATKLCRLLCVYDLGRSVNSTSLPSPRRRFGDPESEALRPIPGLLRREFGLPGLCGRNRVEPPALLPRPGRCPVGVPRAARPLCRATLATEA